LLTRTVFASPSDWLEDAPSKSPFGLLKEHMANPLIQCAVVLYKQRPDQAKSLTTLLEICRIDPSIAEKINIFVQDNSPEASPLTAALTCLPVEYYHAPENPGLAAAYSKAVSIAQKRGIEWLLVLDQDTVLDRHFLLRLFAALQSGVSSQICAFVPKLVNGERVISPMFTRKYSYDPCEFDFQGFSATPLMPCNSASCLNLQWLDKVGGFPQEYWLDFLDCIVFYRLQEAGGRVSVLDAHLEHSLSILNIEAEMSVARYTNMLTAECRFIKDTRARGGPTLHRFRLIKRALMLAIRLNNKMYASQAFRAAFK
jgi:GT2 family glycosyltransferase